MRRAAAIRWLFYFDFFMSLLYGFYHDTLLSGPYFITDSFGFLIMATLLFGRRFIPSEAIFLCFNVRRFNLLHLVKVLVRSVHVSCLHLFL